MAEDLLDIADELYGLLLADFTPARDAKAKQLKGSELAGPVKTLKKPTVAAWVVNMLVRHETEQVDQVLAVGAALRDAAQSLDGKELRELTKQRRQLTAAVTTRARGVAGTLGTKVTQAVADQVEGTLTAAMLDPDCAKALRSGLLITHLSATGVGESAAGAAVALPDALGFAATSAPPVAESPAGRPDLKVVPDPDAEAKRLAAAKAALKEAAGEEEEARSAYVESEQAVSDLQARALQLQGEIEEHQRQIAEHETTAEEVEEELDEAEESRTEARTALRKAEQAREQAESALKRLRRQ
jgi:DNA repair exonuclease SbcCD ATPase subunit